MNKEILVSLIKGSSGEELCDLVLKNGQIVNVFSGEIIRRNLAVKDGYIVGFGDQYTGKKEIDLNNAYVVPGLMDAHIHIESTLATPMEFSKASAKHGITTVVMDPHEIGNVLGTTGLNYMLEASRNLPVDFMMMLPSCVPATEFETSGAILRADDLSAYYDKNEVAGLAEVMDLNAVKNTSEDMMNKLMDARLSHKTIDGHGSGLSPHDNNIYRTAGISTDHECTTLEEAKDRLEKGFYIHIREGSVAKNFDELIPLVNKNNSRRFTFCTDDIYISDLNEHGSIDDMVRRAIQHGLDPVDAIRMATLNPSECYGFKTKGAVAPGYEADFLVVDHLETFHISSVYKNGNLIWEKGELIYQYSEGKSIDMPNTISLPPLTEKDLMITTRTGILNVIEVMQNSLLTNHLVIEHPKDQPYIIDPKDNIAKLMVIERHGNHGHFGMGLVKGFHMKKGAVATTIAHDSHNLVVMGTKDEDMLLAIKRIKEIGGGIVVVCDQRVTAELRLDVAGLMSSAPLEEITEALKRLEDASDSVFDGVDFNPFLTLSFLTLPVIPNLKITDQGLYDAKNAQFIKIDEKEPSAYPHE